MIEQGIGRGLSFPILAVLAAYLVFLGGGWVGIYYLPLRIVSLGLIVVVLAGWTLLAWRRPAWRPASRLWLGFVVALLVMAVSTALSRHPRFGVDYLAYATLLVALYLLMVRIFASPFLRPRFLGLVVILALMVGVLYVVQVGSTWIRWWDLVGRVAVPPLRPEFSALTFGNPSAVMTVSILLGLPAIASIGFGSRARVAASVSLLALSLFCTIISGSRAGWLGLALGIALTTALWLIPRDHRSEIRRSLRSRSLRVGLIGCAAVVVALTPVVLPGVLARMSSGGEGLRLAFFEAALRMFAESPVHGTGPGTWVAQRMAYTNVPANDIYIPYAHDLYLQTLAEFGVLGALAGVLAAFLVARLFVRAHQSRDADRKAMAWAGILGLAYFLGHQILDFYPNMPAALFAMAIPIAWLDAADLEAGASVATGIRGRLTPPQEIAVGRAAVLAGIALVVTAVGWLTVSESRALIHESAVALVDQGAWPEALDQARNAAAADPDLPPTQLTLALAATKAGHPDEAGAAFRRAAEADDFPASWLGLAAAQADLGDVAGARDSLGRALRLGVVQPAIALASAGLYVRLGDRDAARQSFLQAVLDAPNIFGDRQLGRLVEPVMTLDELADLAIERTTGGTTAVEIALELERREDAESLMARVDPASRTLFGTVIPAWFGDEGAWSELTDRARAEPTNIVLQNWSARVAVRRGSGSEALRYFDIANIDNGLSGTGGTELRIVLPGAGRGGDGTSTTAYGIFTYRRSTPDNLIPESVVGLIGR